MTRTLPDAYTVFKHIEGLIRTVPSLGQRVYTGYVPDTLPKAGQHILPYCALWPGAGTPDGQEAVAGGPDLHGQVFTFTTTIAGAEPWAVLGTAGELKRILTGARLGRDGGIIRPDPIQQRAATVLMDRDVTPARPYLPLAWTVQTSTNP